MELKKMKEIEKTKDQILVSTFNEGNLCFGVAGSKSSGKIIRIALPGPHKNDVLKEFEEYYDKFELSEEYHELAQEINQIYQGDNIKIHKENFAINPGENKTPIQSEFERRVLVEVSKIPKGEVRTYKEIASSLGSRGWRAVGNVMAKNPFPLLIPCHRVVKSDLTIGNYRGGVAMKKELLKNEGIEISGQKVVRPE
jgi:methylated-DNA-[protein]-cysteine S-methyltransferase